MELKAAGLPAAAVAATTRSRLVYWLLLGQFLAHLATFAYLHVHVTRLEREIRELGLGAVAAGGAGGGVGGCRHEVRRKRSSAIPSAEDNAVSEVFRVSAL